MYEQRSGSRASRLLQIASEVHRLGTESVDPKLAGSRAEAVAAVFPDGAPEPLAGEDLVRVKRAYFNVCARDTLNSGAWIGDMRLPRRRRCALAPGTFGQALTIENGVPAHRSRFEQRVVTAVAALATEIATCERCVIVAGDDLPALTRRVTEASGLTRAQLAALDVADPFAGMTSIGVSLPYVLVRAKGTVVLAEAVNPWHAVAEAQEAGASFGDAIAIGVLMMAAEAGIVPIPFQLIAPNGVTATIERVRQEQRLITKLDRWRALAEGTGRVPEPTANDVVA